MYLVSKRLLKSILKTKTQKENETGKVSYIGSYVHQFGN